ncbi:MAG: class I SAM-dependent methyltransferase [Anaerolineae bacterium]|nr:class I SAM-dependent methyltransferase [Anaerolineae bacterium]
MHRIGYDYERDPERFRANVEAVRRYGLEGDVHEAVARRLAAEGLAPVLDLGCGEGRFARPARAIGLSTIALDCSATMLGALAGARVQGDARRLPFRSSTFGGVVALYMLYHLPDPGEAIAESYRLLRPGGLFAACAPSRTNDLELTDVLGPESPATFDAEVGPAMVRRFFAHVEVESWDAPLVHLPDREALALYLRGRGLCRRDAARAIRRVSLPVTLTTRGALIYGRKLGSAV